MKIDYRKLIEEFIAVLIASMFMAIGIVFELFAALGGDSITVIEEGLSKTLGVMVGTASILYSTFMITLVFFFARKYLGWTTIANALMIGSFMNLFYPLLAPIFTSDILFYRYLVLLASVVLISIGCVILIRYQSGMNTADALATEIAARLHVEFRYARIALDGLMIGLGYVLGGTVGIGTIIAMALTGPAIDYINKLVDVFKAMKTSE
ncbi:MAG: hypothetical protein IJJ19_00050 [Erysipelotrichaceae bacterium]|nr:hypothetical protein [Erysipelotrichaceae bacterium]